MAYSKTNLFVISIVILVKMASAAGGVGDIFKHVAVLCSPYIRESENFTIGSEYDKKLELVLGDITTGIPSTGYVYKYATGVNDTVLLYARGQCRPDISTADCATCVQKLTKEASRRCPVQKSVFGWLEGCLLKYSNVNFYGEIGSELDAYYVVKHRNVKRIISRQGLRNFLVGVSEKAYASEKLFAKDVVQLPAAAAEEGGAGSRNLYGMAECSHDLNNEGCKSCLHILIKLATGYSYGKGMQFFLSACTLQYSFRPFFDIASIN